MKNLSFCRTLPFAMTVMLAVSTCTAPVFAEDGIAGQSAKTEEVRQYDDWTAYEKAVAEALNVPEEAERTESVSEDGTESEKRFSWTDEDGTMHERSVTMKQAGKASPVSSESDMVDSVDSGMVSYAGPDPDVDMVDSVDSGLVGYAGSDSEYDELDSVDSGLVGYAGSDSEYDELDSVDSGMVSYTGSDSEYDAVDSVDSGLISPSETKVVETTRTPKTTQETYTQEETYTEKQTVQTGTETKEESTPLFGIYSNDEDLAAIKSLTGDYGVTAGQVMIGTDFESNVNAGILDSSAGQTIGTNPKYIYHLDAGEGTADSTGNMNAFEGFSEGTSRVQLRQGTEPSVMTRFGNTEDCSETVSVQKANEDPNDQNYFINIDANGDGEPDRTVTVSNCASAAAGDASCQSVEHILANAAEHSKALAGAKQSAGVAKETADQNNSRIDTTGAAGTDEGKSRYKIVYVDVTAVPSVQLNGSVDYNKLNQDGYWTMTPEEQAQYVSDNNIGTVIYKLEGFSNTDSMTLSMNEDQIVVLNVHADKASTIQLNQFRFAVAESGGNVRNFRSQDKTDDVSKYSQQVVFNFSDYAGDLEFDGSLAGTFIAPKANVIVRSSSAGQILADSFANTSGEWHYTGNSAGTKITKTEVPVYEKVPVTKTREVTKTRDVTTFEDETFSYILRFSAAGTGIGTGDDKTDIDETDGTGTGSGHDDEKQGPSPRPGDDEQDGTGTGTTPGGSSETETGTEPSEPADTDTETKPDEPAGTDTETKPDEPTGTDTETKPDEPTGTDTETAPDDDKSKGTGTETGTDTGTDTETDNGRTTDTNIGTETNDDRTVDTDTNIETDNDRTVDTDTKTGDDRTVITDTDINTIDDKTVNEKIAGPDTGVKTEENRDDEPEISQEDKERTQAPGAAKTIAPKTEPAAGQTESGTVTVSCPQTGVQENTLPFAVLALLSLTALSALAVLPRRSRTDAEKRA